MSDNFLKKLDRNTILAGVAILAVIIVGVLIFANKGLSNISFLGLGQSNDQIAKTAVDYINKNLLQGSTATLVSVSEESGLVKMKLKVGTSEYDSYATKDGKLLFPEAFSIKPGNSQNANINSGGKTAEEILAAIKKSDKPEIDAFVVSRCPYGLQMQRMMADATKNIPDLTNYLKIRYIGSVSGNTITSMHGDAEAQENLRQICIREEQSSKYWNYVSCQMKSGDTAGCQSSTGIDSVKLNACTSTASRGVAFAKKDFDLANKYSVSGSPTLIVNGATVDEFTSDNQPVFGSSRSSDELKTVVCSAQNSKAGFCSTKLNTAQAATSFSETYEGSGTSGNSGATGAGCEPAQ